ncbi:hypothetical protein CA13_50300 [Planctomycetes bacterium CA13]|uniref:Uncharacterized protein n=1 Tax=Novipirellula herctigrandis TaxID=2527986 RepID=A0A5C5Z8D4_9BACT|nr:hypothetical protein CA13_50300 [Planctomycetes bacterium CA13]
MISQRFPSLKSLFFRCILFGSRKPGFSFFRASIALAFFRFDDSTMPSRIVAAAVLSERNSDFRFCHGILAKPVYRACRATPRNQAAKWGN